MSNNDFHKGWLKVEGFLNRGTANIMYAHVLLAKRRLEIVQENTEYMDLFVDKKYHEKLWGTFDDDQVVGEYSKYGDLIFETLLLGKRKELSEITQINLVPQYSYYRLYTEGSELVKHKDRKSCEISVSLCLGFNSHYNWPLCFEDRDGKEISVNLEPGDMVIYKGFELTHWRNTFVGKNHAQVFLHYNDLHGRYGDTKYDGRKGLGLPRIYDEEEIDDVR